jgi:hypothetical protein
MELQHINVKLYLQEPESVKLDALVPVFHGWIQNKVCEELLIDVADYRHVHGGPGVVVIGHQADYSVDNTDNRLGIRYNRKAALEGSNRDRFSQALRAALQACQRLESDEKLEGTLRFDRQNLKLFVYDRLLAPKSEQTTNSVQGELENFFGSVFADVEFGMKFDNDQRSLVGVHVNTARRVQVDEMLARLS